MSLTVPGDATTDLVADIRAYVGDRLIGIGYHRRQEWTTVYARDDFAERYLPEQREQMAERVILKGLGKDVEESVWGFGSLQYTMTEFEQAIVVHVPLSPTEGFVVGIEPSARNHLYSLVETCRNHRPETTG